MRSADAFVVHGARGAPNLQPLNDALQQTISRGSIPVFTIDDVQDHIDNHYPDGIDVSALPHLRPPYPMTLFEFPNATRNERRIVIAICDDDDGRVGVFNEAEADEDAAVQSPGISIEGHLTLIVWMHNGRDTVLGPCAVWTFALSAHGLMLGNRWMVLPPMDQYLDRINGSVEKGEQAWPTGTPDVDPHQDWVHAVCAPVLVGMNLLHCKNVDAERHRQPDAVARAFQRRHGRRPVSWHTLRVVVPGRAGDTAGGPGRPGSVVAFHSVRGYFAHYGQCCDESIHPPRGLLFGRLEGLFWIPDHARGDRAVGVVKKDYEEVVR